MPYPIITKDNLTISGIPDDVPANDQRLKDAVAQMRATGTSALTWADIVPFDTENAPPTAPVRTRGVLEQAAMDVPQNLGVAARGAIQGAASIATSITDPLTMFVNQFLPEEWKQLPPSQGLSLALDTLGVPNAETKAQEILQATTAGLGAAAGSVATGGVLSGGSKTVGPVISSIPTIGKTGESVAQFESAASKSLPGARLPATTLRQGIGQTMAAQPAQQAAGAMAAGAASEGVEQSGGSPALQFAAGLSAGVLGSRIGSPSTKIAARAIQSEDEIGDLIRKAAAGDKGARKTVAELASINKTAKEAAERLELDLPPDVFSDNPQVRAAAGLGRSIHASEEAARWVSTVRNAVDRADQVLEDFGATFIEGTPAPAVASARVKDSMLAAQKELKTLTDDIYKEIDNAVPKSTPATFSNAKKTLAAIAEEVGGGGMSAQEKSLLAMTNDPKTTYGRLLREKNLIGQAIAKKDSPYGNMEAGALKRLYDALSKDQLDSVSAIAGDEVKERLAQATATYAKKKELEKSIVTLFGKDFQGSISEKMRAAITSSAKGDTGAFTRLVDQVPEELRKEVIATSLASVMRSGQGATKGGFGFSEFAKMYPQLRANTEVYSKIAKGLGKDSDAVLRDLYEVSKRITDARSQVLGTGKANQALLQGLTSQSVLEKVLSSVPARSAVTAGGAAIGGGLGGGVFGSSVGAGLSNAVVESLTRGERGKLEAVGALFRNKQFQDMLVDATINDALDPAKVRAAVRTEAFQKFAKAVKLPGKTEQLDTWMLAAALPKQQRAETDRAAPRGEYAER